jgi:Tol biopolymer transport system component
MDRVWGWHPQYAPDGACFFNQMPNDSERPLYAGHERWSFHDRSVLAIAYGDSPGRPRGVYESFVDGRPQRLISEGDRDMHLDVSRDGRWVVVDTSGAHDLPGKGWENADCISDILFIDRQSGERRFAARSSITKHPSHPHPVFSPDGSRVYFNEGERDGTRNRVWWALNPFVV